MEFDLKAHTILLTLGGSRIYGTNTADSDVDVRGVMIAPKSTYFGFLHNFDHADSPLEMAAFTELLRPEEKKAAKATKLEGTIYELRKFMKLAAGFNPNVVEPLFCRDEDVLLMTDLGRLLRKWRSLFISQLCLASMTGYSGGQIRRIKNGHDPAADGTPRGKKLAYQVVRLMRTCKELLLTGQFNVWRGGIDAQELVEIKNGSWSSEKIVAFFEEQDAELRAICKSDRAVIPKEPDRKAIDQLCCELVESGLFGRVDSAKWVGLAKGGRL